MRANVPVDDFSVTQPPVEEGQPIDKVTPEMKELAKLGKSPDWTIITKYLDARIEHFKNGLFGENLEGADAATLGNRFLAAQSVIAEFTNLKQEVERSTATVDEAAQASGE